MRPASRRHGTIFDEVPTLYDRYRPSYPDAAIAALVGWSGVAAGARVLEVGAGTGQLTLQLPARGFEVTAVEPGPRMAALLGRKLGERVRIVVARFEDAAIASGSFDLVASGTAFHWIDPERRYGLAARALRTGGALGILRNEHPPALSSEAYFTGVDFIYRRLAPELVHVAHPRSEPEVPTVADDLVASGHFELVAEGRFEWEQRYTADAIVGLLRTYSDHRALAPRRRAALLREIRAFVATELGGSFVDCYVTSVTVGRAL